MIENLISSYILFIINNSDFDLDKLYSIKIHGFIDSTFSESIRVITIKLLSNTTHSVSFNLFNRTYNPDYYPIIKNPHDYYFYFPNTELNHLYFVSNHSNLVHMFFSIIYKIPFKKTYRPSYFFYEFI